MSLADIGIEYTAAADNISLSTSTYCVFQLTTTSAVPVFLKKLVATSSQTASTIAAVRLGIMTTAGTGGTSITPKATNGGVSRAATSTVVSLATLGTINYVNDAQQWNEFSPYEFNLIPSGILVPVSTSISLQLYTAPAAGFFASFTAVFSEIA
jgi:hypothetical protein